MARKRGYELPEELGRRETRLNKIREIKPIQVARTGANAEKEIAEVLNGT